MLCSWISSHSRRIWPTGSAKAVFEDYENQKMLLSDAGVEDFNIEDYSEEELDSLYGSIKEKLGSAGVSEEWKNHTDMEPFFMMG